jgi:hypothetical protein
MRKEKALQIVGVVIFLAVTTLTYGVVTPVNKTTNASLDAVTSKITNMSTNTSINTSTNTTDDTTSRLTKDYHILTAIAVGLVIAIVAVFFIGFW